MSLSLRTSRVLIATASAAALLGSAAPASAAPVTGVQTAVAPNPALVNALTSLGASVRLTGAATQDSEGRFQFPVTGGDLSPDLKGRVNHTGGIEFRNRSGVKFGIRSFVIDTRATPQLTAEPTLGGYGLGIRLPVATIADVAVSSAPPATVVSGTLKLNDIGALYINTFLGKAAVKRGTVFGQAQAAVTVGS